jgi:hypothetical protein
MNMNELKHRCKKYVAEREQTRTRRGQRRKRRSALGVFLKNPLKIALNEFAQNERANIAFVSNVSLEPRSAGSDLIASYPISQ